MHYIKIIYQKFCANEHFKTILFRHSNILIFELLMFAVISLRQFHTYSYSINLTIFIHEQRPF